MKQAKKSPTAPKKLLKKVHISHAGEAVCKCTTKCSEKGWCFVDKSCPVAIKGQRGYWRYCDAKTEEYKMDTTELMQYWWDKKSELLENLKPLNRKMIAAGHKAQAGKYDIKLKPINLSDARLYHPIRGPSEREAAVESLNKRKDALVSLIKKGKLKFIKGNVIWLGKTYDFFSQEIWNQIPVMRSKDMIQAVAVWNDEDFDTVCSIDVKCKKLPMPQYLVVSGQGRLLAMREAFVDEMDWNDIKVEVEIGFLDDDTCEELNEVRDEYMSNGELLGEYGLKIKTCENKDKLLEDMVKNISKTNIKDLLNVCKYLGIPTDIEKCKDCSDKGTDRDSCYKSCVAENISKFVLKTNL